MVPVILWRALQRYEIASGVKREPKTLVYFEKRSELSKNSVIRMTLRQQLLNPTVHRRVPYAREFPFDT